MSPDPFTGALNEEDAAEHKRQHENYEPHQHGDYVEYHDHDDPLSNLPGEPGIPKDEALKPHVADKPEEDEGHGVQHEHETPHEHEDVPLETPEVDDAPNDEEVEKEVEETL
jgi:hypothetical protein